MKNNPLISIVVPAYNVEKYIKKCLLSISRQTYGHLQIIVVDDGSFDETGMICDQVSGLDARIEVYHTENRGLVRARKEGLSHAKGEYVGFVDGDDYIDEIMYEKLLENMLDTEADFVHSCFIENVDGQEKEVILVPDELLVMNEIENRVDTLVNYFLERNEQCFISPSIWSKLFRRQFICECYDKVANEQQYGEDVLCLFYSIMRAEKISLMSKCYYHYIVRPQSLSHIDKQTRFLKEISLSHYIVKFNEVYKEYPFLTEKISEYLCRGMFRLGQDIVLGRSVPKFYFGNISNLAGQKILLYGAGRVGIDYYSQICKYQNCQIVAWADKKWDSICLDYAKLVAPIEAVKEDFDVVLIAIENADVAKMIAEELRGMGVPGEKIVWKIPKKY